MRCDDKQFALDTTDIRRTHTCPLSPQDAEPDVPAATARMWPDPNRPGFAVWCMSFSITPYHNVDGSYVDDLLRMDMCENILLEIEAEATMLHADGIIPKLICARERGANDNPHLGGHCFFSTKERDAKKACHFSLSAPTVRSDTHSSVFRRRFPQPSRRCSTS